MKLMSSTGKASVELNQEKTALIFKSLSKSGTQEWMSDPVYWPIKDWEALKKSIDFMLEAT